MLDSHRPRVRIDTLRPLHGAGPGHLGRDLKHARSLSAARFLSRRPCGSLKFELWHVSARFAPTPASWVARQRRSAISPGWRTRPRGSRTRLMDLSNLTALILVVAIGVVGLVVLLLIQY